MAKVLIVEDDGVIARGMARHLESAGFDAVAVASGETGLARLRYERPDVCVLDLMLPGVDGWRVIEQARAYLRTLETFHLPAQAKPEPQMALFDPAGAEILKLLDGADADGLSPKEALDLVYRLKKLRDRG